MKRLLVLLVLAPLALAAQDNPNYDPDYDGDGCYTVTDILGLLPLFGSCGDTVPTFACGDSVLFDNYWYATTLIGDQCWFAENLRTQLYANGDSIAAELTDAEWVSTTAGATAVYGEGSSECTNNTPAFDACDEAQSIEEYGRLYNWYAVDDARGLCPSGWHVPTLWESNELKNYITSQGFAGTEGSVLKSTSGWFGDGNGTDDFGFSALPGGFRFNYEGYFQTAGSIGCWWSSSLGGDYAWQWRMANYSYIMVWGNVPKRDGSSVRCLKDTE